VVGKFMGCGDFANGLARVRCDHCQSQMRIVALIDQADVIERILRHLGVWEAGVRVESARDPPQPAEPILEPWLENPFPDYDHEPVFAQN
jgi:hypothetical protein